MTADQPWFKFFPSDWRADQALRIVSLAARGLWIECMCIMHEARPYGHLVVNGRPVTEAQLAVLAGTSPDQIPALLGELESAGVFSRTGAGVVYSRRMTRDDKRSRVNRKNGKLGGNPTLCKDEEKSQSVKRRHKAEDKAKRPEARVQNTPLYPPASGGKGDDEFWRGRTRSAWRRSLELYRDRRMWSLNAGPEPFEPGCEAPPDLVEEILGSKKVEVA